MTAPPRSRTCRHGVRASLGTTEMYLYDEVGAFGVSASQFVADLRAAGSGTVALHVNSPGGDAFDGLAIYEALRQHPGPTTVYVDGMAASAASVIAMGADEVVMAPAGMIMIHDALSLTYGNEAEHLQSAALLGKVSDQLAAIYAARAGGSVSSWRASMRRETWYTASEAVDAGLADRVAEPPVPVSALARLDRAAARREQGVGSVAAVVRESIRTANPRHPLLGVVAARAGGPARRPVGRRPVPSAMTTLSALRAAR